MSPRAYFMEELAIFVGLLLLAAILIPPIWLILDPQSRYITLIVLGVSLVLVSFLYTRHREKLRRYL